MSQGSTSGAVHHRRAGRAAAVFMATALVLAGCTSSGDSADNDTAPSGDPGVAVVPPEVAAAKADWPLPGRDYANSRARADSTITADNVAELEVAWSVPLPGGSAYGNASTTPLVLGDTVYVQDLQSNVHAIDLATGETPWRHDFDLFKIGPNGVALGYGKVHVAKGSTEIAALDAETGEKVWSFDTVKSEDLWGNPELNSGGGAWFPPAIDVERELVYWGIGNPAPFPGTEEFPNGSSRPGPNLYTDSVVALDLRTGELAWYHQAVPHDLFDRDLQLTAIAQRPDGDLVIGTGKPGRVIALDPASGDVVSDTEVGTHQNDDLTELSGPTEVLPGLFGGVETPPAVADGIVYTAVLNAPSIHDPEMENFLGGAEIGVLPGDLVAVDAASGEVLWSTTIDGDPLGGALVMGDLVFTATFQGAIIAVDRATGEIVHTITAPGGINGWAAATADTILWPVGMADPPALVAYRIPSR